MDNGQAKSRKYQGVFKVSSKDMAFSMNLVSTIGAQTSPKKGTESGIQKSKRSLLANHERCKCSMETTHN